MQGKPQYGKRALGQKPERPTSNPIVASPAEKSK